MHFCNRKADDSSTQLVHPVDDPSNPESRFKSDAIKQAAMLSASTSHADVVAATGKSVTGFWFESKIVDTSSMTAAEVRLE